MHLSVELKSAILYFIHTSSLLPGMPTEYRDPDKHLSRDDLRELMDNATMVYSLARHIFERWPTSPSLKLVPEPGRKRVTEEAEPNGDQEAPLRSDPAAPTKPRRPRV